MAARQPYSGIHIQYTADCILYTVLLSTFFGSLPDFFPKIITHPLDEIFRLLKAGRLGDLWVGVFSSTGFHPALPTWNPSGIFPEYMHGCESFLLFSFF